MSDICGFFICTGLTYSVLSLLSIENVKILKIFDRSTFFQDIPGIPEINPVLTGMDAGQAFFITFILPAHIITA